MYSIVVQDFDVIVTGQIPTREVLALIASMRSEGSAKHAHMNSLTRAYTSCI